MILVILHDHLRISNPAILDPLKDKNDNRTHNDIDDKRRDVPGYVAWLSGRCPPSQMEQGRMYQLYVRPKVYRRKAKESHL